MRTVSAPPPPLVEMEAYTDADLGISAAEARDAKGKVRTVVKSFNPELTFTNQERDAIAAAVVYLEAHLPKLAVCKRSWGTCALLPRAVNNRTTYWKAQRASRARAAVAAASGPAVRRGPRGVEAIPVAVVVAPTAQAAAAPPSGPAVVAAAGAARQRRQRQPSRRLTNLDRLR